MNCKEDKSMKEFISLNKVKKIYKLGNIEINALNGLEQR